LFRAVAAAAISTGGSREPALLDPLHHVVGRDRTGALLRYREPADRSEAAPKELLAAEPTIVRWLPEPSATAFPAA